MWLEETIWGFACLFFPNGSGTMLNLVVLHCIIALESSIVTIVLGIFIKPICDGKLFYQRLIQILMR